MLTPKDFKDTAVRLPIRPVHINGERIFRPPELVRITKTGRKYVFTENGGTFQPCESDPEQPYFIETTEYSPEYKLFPTVESAREYVLRDRLVRYVRDAAERLPDVGGHEVSVGTLMEIARLLGLSDARLNEYEACARPKGEPKT